MTTVQTSPFTDNLWSPAPNEVSPLPELELIEAPPFWSWSVNGLPEVFDQRRREPCSTVSLMVALLEPPMRRIDWPLAENEDWESDPLETVLSFVTLPLPDELWLSWTVLPFEVWLD
jgi:hypothetical protein